MQSHIAPWLITLLRPIHSFFMPTYFDLTKIKGLEHIPSTGAAILAPIHRSRWDPVMMQLLTRRPMHFMTSQNEFKGAQKWFMERLGAFPINAEKPNASSVKYTQDLLRDEQLLVVFPEGGLRYFAPGEIFPLKLGVAWIALTCQKELPEVSLPIIPIRFRYGDRVLRFRSRVEIELYAPLYVKDYMQMPTREAMRRLTADLQQALGEVVNDQVLDHPKKLALP